ncbi:beta-galactosidase [Actinoplanes sp. NBRC 101535]|uniref:beta-galactosidase n=1 Tax=Actinoplanes sp. NBRC 101535 TaxID=3032196 RepID=UPI0024A41945|nr:beta-galactosidase [Actinoplanes sp. NBRC 101535]GLY04440.1 hypothetical protein Acsp01_48190 [Actinoplanes sp. NBRC 101535]
MSSIEDVTIHGPHGPIPIRVYDPGEPSGAALLWAHGGGFRHGDLDMRESDMVAAEISRRAGALVVAVGYRLAVGGVRHPVPVDDVHAAWQWMTGKYQPVTAGIGGASAGAALALASALRSRDENERDGGGWDENERGDVVRDGGARDGGGRAPDTILLAYPFLHFPNPGPYEHGVEEMVRNYVGRISDVPADAFPGHARLEGLPPVHVLLSENDHLRPSGELIVRQLHEAGVAATVFVAAGTAHGHLNRPLEDTGVAESLEFLAAGLARGRRRWIRRDGPPRIEFGADYNPEQWPPETWPEDVRLMREAGVTVVSLGIFSWARLEPAEGQWDFGWLDEVMDLLHSHGILVDLATPTASPPPWLTRRHPEILPVDRHGHTVGPGARQHWRPTSPVFREHALRLVRAVATRYGGHPALTAWHISNELGCHNVYDFSDDAAVAFRSWLRDRYRTLDALNHAWGTAFWSQRYGDWAEILPPRLLGGAGNPTQALDFKRFSSDALRDHLRAERAVLRELTPDVPVTTNFMVAGPINEMDYADWASGVDFVANDHYVRPGPQARDELSFSANLTGNIAGGRPWFLMEHSTGAVNWQPVNVPKRRGELARDSLTHVAHGADGVCFFQWRQSRAGAEKYHSAMLPHGGVSSAVFRDVADLGARLAALSAVSGLSRTRASAAILVDADSWWAAEQDSHPTSRLDYRGEALNWYSTFLDLGVRADVVPAGGDWSGYRLVVAPILHVVPQRLRDRLENYVHGGGHLLATYFSGTVDENDHLWPGGYPGALRDLLGVRVEEFAPLLDGETVTLSDGTAATVWTERVTVTDPAVEVLLTYPDGGPAVTRRALRAGSAAYTSCVLPADGRKPVLDDLLRRAGVSSELPVALRGRVEPAVRGPVWFLINRTDEPVDLADVDGATGELPARGVVVLL